MKESFLTFWQTYPFPPEIFIHFLVMMKSRQENFVKLLIDMISYATLFVVEEKAHDVIIGLLEFSFSLVHHDFSRFVSYGIALDEQTDCRMGICIADSFQSVGLGTSLIPLIKKIAKTFAQNRIILLGGVLAENTRAIQFYQKAGFKLLGNFQNQDSQKVSDVIMEICSDSLIQ